ncbi:MULTISPECIES: hypothetical protein [unclassified Streptomyces]|uniref:hypothetical protein n=1 Tax=unclassified Streptomyces TaxID=2593676 RepID=UPI002DDA0D3C|nr:hypothetical protein [Streptomyces sp. NBC_01788]WSB30774.1 hypothetical protein OIE49_35705 [Streptomyces sp. NBC_01788]
MASADAVLRAEPEGHGGNGDGAVAEDDPEQTGRSDQEARDDGRDGRTAPSTSGRRHRSEDLQFMLLVIVNVCVGGLVGLERSTITSDGANPTRPRAPTFVCRV